MKMQITKIVENKDGSATVTLDYDEDVTKLIRKYYNRKRVTKNLVKKFVLEGLGNYLKREKENG